MSNEALKVGIIDDNKGALPIIEASISSLLKEKGINYEMFLFNDPKKFELCPPEDKSLDLFFCDIEMPGMDGIELAKKYLEKHPTCSIIFISNREDRVFDSFQVHPFGFIRKKNFITDIKYTLESYLEKLSKESENTICFQFQTSFKRVSIDKIIYIESDKKNQYVYIDGDPEPMKIRSTMNELCEKLESKGFLLTHKSFLVNYIYILEIADNSVILKNGRSVFLSKQKSAEIKKKYLELITNNTNFIF